MLRNLDCKPPGFLAEAHHGAFRRELAVDINLKLHAWDGGYVAGLWALSEGAVINAGLGYKPVIFGLDSVQEIGWSPHSGAPGIGAVADTERSASKCLVGSRLPSPIRPRSCDRFDLIKINLRLGRWRVQVRKIALARDADATAACKSRGTQRRRLV